MAELTRIFFKGRPCTPPIVHGVSFEPVEEGNEAGLWVGEATDDQLDSLDVPNDLYRLSAEDFGPVPTGEGKPGPDLTGQEGDGTGGTLPADEGAEGGAPADQTGAPAGDDQTGAEGAGEAAGEDAGGEAEASSDATGTPADEPTGSYKGMVCPSCGYEATVNVPEGEKLLCPAEGCEGILVTLEEGVLLLSIGDMEDKLAKEGSLSKKDSQKLAAFKADLAALHTA